MLTFWATLYFVSGGALNSILTRWFIWRHLNTHYV